MRTTMKSTTLWEENKMKILEDYKKIAHELLFEVDDEKMIKYKDKDGESKEMKAGSAKTMPMDHPAKQAWDKMQDADDDSGAEKEKGQKIGGSDFDRDGGDDYKPKYDTSPGGGLRFRSGDDREKMEKEYDVRIPKGEMKPDEYGEDDTAEAIADALAKKFDISREYAMSRAKEETDGDKFYIDFADELETEFQEMADEGGQQRYDEPMFDTQGMEKMKYGGGDDSGDSDDSGEYEGDFEVDSDPKKYAGLESYEVEMAKDADKEIAQHGKFRNGTSLPPGTDFRTKLDDLDEDDVEAFYDEVADKYAKKHDITMGVMDDNKNILMDEEGMTMSDLVAGIISSAEEAEAEGGYMKYGESVKPKKKPFLREQLERFGGGRY